MDIQTALKQPLEFGNPTQIEALKIRRKEIAEQEEETEQMKGSLIDLPA